MKIIPAILENNLNDLTLSIGNLLPYFTHFQIDISDGIYTPNKTVDIDELKDLQIVNPQVLFDFHLMVNDPQYEIEKIVNLKNININTILVQIDKISQLDLSRPLNIATVLNPQDSVDEYFEMINEYPYTQIMTVNPGYQGQKFLEANLEKITELKNLSYNGQIYLDGGINDLSLPLIDKNEYKPDFLCVGSFLKINTEEKLQLFEKLNVGK